MRPSEVLDEPWHWAQRVHGNWPPLTERSGKWLVFFGSAPPVVNVASAGH